MPGIWVAVVIVTTPDRQVRGQLDGRDPGLPNYPALRWAGVSMYREWDLGQPWVHRPAGADPGKLPGELWWSPSRLDQITVMSEIMTKKYHGQTVLHMLSALFAVLIEDRSVEEVRKELGLN
jgi:hypothetical protein